MNKALSTGLFLSMAFALTAVPAWAQIRLEITGFGGYGFNLAFPSSVAVDSAFASGTAGYDDAWRPFFHDPVLELGAGAGFGARVALWFGLIGFEGSFESSLAQPRFHEASVSALEARMQSTGYTPYFTMVANGGQMMKFYGNLIFYVLPSEVLRPYLTAGIGSTSYTIEPSISINRPSYAEEMDLWYAGSSALTINGGGGFSFWFTPVIGLRVDARFFYGLPTFRQTYFYKTSGDIQWHTDSYVTQSGPHIDAVIAVGLIARIL
ncbi:MAG: hypothetical protein NTZ26_09690 [Candidatus Aminicenantes bacterium]|nr:hypothetical protein [Candidatus Aminicenantes bacterium]